MTRLDIKITGIEGITTKLDKVAAGRYMYDAMDASMKDIHLYITKYPPKRGAVSGTAFSPVRFKTSSGAAVEFMALSRGWTRQGRKVHYEGYKRTGKLGQSWTIRIRQSGVVIVGKVGTNLEYAPYVQSATRQAWMHRGRWRTDTMAIDKHRARIVARFRAAIQEALR